jgi:HPt (histidine-containing phosphotransfer) domain-containing protein
LKSSAAQLGALRMQRLCAQGEALARAGTLDPVPELMHHLEEEFPRVKTWLERALNPKIA